MLRTPFTLYHKKSSSHTHGFNIQPSILTVPGSTMLGKPLSLVLMGLATVVVSLPFVLVKPGNDIIARDTQPVDRVIVYHIIDGTIAAEEDE
ncbi:hypothetical protein F5Y14DRAFT_456988 [Nemania sp. NC0429]|nr:hypothetical protein F5Y14DRAFT_456988 [Nemania sp. NC0429]